VPFGAPTVFNFYPPTYRIPGTTDVAPEFKLLNAQLLQQRANDPSALVHWRDGGEGFRNGGCSRDAWDAAMAEGNDAAIELISNRLFRGAMPSYVRDVLVSGVLAVRPGSPDLRIYDAVGIAALSPAWGVMR
jgi:hypothetical protein